MTGKPKFDDREQSKRFIETARKIGAENESSAADELMGKLAKQPKKSEKSSEKGD
jgi:hypothetical protein